MKINQVEELVDITKKNIRFYEDQGLVAPRRNPENGYLDRMKELERGGVQFMNVKKSDVKTRATGAILAGVIMIVFMLAVMVAFLVACAANPAPIGAYLIGVAAPIAIIVGIVVVLRQRLKELKGGELDEASKY